MFVLVVHAYSMKASFGRACLHQLLLTSVSKYFKISLMCIKLISVDNQLKIFICFLLLMPLIRMVNAQTASVRHLQPVFGWQR